MQFKYKKNFMEQNTFVEQFTRMFMRRQRDTICTIQYPSYMDIYQYMYLYTKLKFVP